MHRVSRIALALGVIFLLLGMTLREASASKGVPGSPEFGFGAVLYPGPSAGLDQTLRQASGLMPDWIYIPVKLASCFPAADRQNLAALDQILTFTSQHQTAAAISLTDAPEWAMTPDGPDAGIITRIVQYLIERYPNKIQAIELFPRANTRLGWGRPANPKAYVNLFSQVFHQVQVSGETILLVAAGLQPLGNELAPEDMNDLRFLQALYDQGIYAQGFYSAGSFMPVVSLQFVELTGDPLSTPSDEEYRVLRHYEQVERVMSANQHDDGLIWITRISLPNGVINPSDQVYSDPARQVKWLNEIYSQLRSQLYIGAVFPLSYNPGWDSGIVTIFRPDGTKHAYYPVLKEMIGQGGVTLNDEIPGRPKDGMLPKQRN